jgi:hypothetical protein
MFFLIANVMNNAEPSVRIRSKVQQGAQTAQIYEQTVVKLIEKR